MRKAFLYLKKNEQDDKQEYKYISSASNSFDSFGIDYTDAEQALKNNIFELMLKTKMLYMDNEKSKSSKFNIGVKRASNFIKKVDAWVTDLENKVSEVIDNILQEIQEYPDRGEKSLQYYVRRSLEGFEEKFIENKSEYISFRQFLYLNSH